jgi:mannosyltransferase
VATLARPRRVLSSRPPAPAGAALAGPPLLAAALCLLDITSRSINLDESATIAIVSQHGHALGDAIARDGGNMSGYYLLLHALVDLFGTGVAVIRLPSAVAVTATVALTTLLGRRLFDARTGLCAGLLAAVSLPLVAWGQDARGYAPVVALVTASMLALVVAMQGGSRKAFLAYWLCLGSAAYMSFVAVLVVPAQLLIVALCWRSRLRSVLAALAACAVSWVPLVLLAGRRGSGQLFWVQAPKPSNSRQVLEALVSSGMRPDLRATFVAVPLLVASALLVLVSVWRAVRARSSGVALVAAWLVVPVALALAESELGQSIWIPRNLLTATPAVALLLAWGVFASRSPRMPRILRVPRHPQVPAWTVFALLLVARLVPVLALYGVSPEDWKSVTAYVQARSRRGDCVAFYPSDARMAFEYYLRDGAPIPIPVLPTLPFGTVRPFVEDYRSLSVVQVREFARGCSRLWLVSSHSGQSDGPPASRANRARYLALRGALRGSYTGRLVRKFGYAAVIRVDLFARARTDPYGRSVKPTNVSALRPISSTTLTAISHL